MSKLDLVRLSPQRRQAQLSRLAYRDLSNNAVDPDFDEVNIQSLTEHYSDIQRRQPSETQYSYA